MGETPLTEADVKRLGPRGIVSGEPLDSFGATLCQDTEVVSALREEFDDAAESIIRQLKEGRPLKGEETVALCIIQELIHNSGTSELVPPQKVHPSS